MIKGHLFNDNFEFFRAKAVKTKETAREVTTRKLPKAKPAIARQARKSMVLELSCVIYHRGYTSQWKNIERYGPLLAILFNFINTFYKHHTSFINLAFINGIHKSVLCKQQDSNSRNYKKFCFYFRSIFNNVVLLL